MKKKNISKEESEVTIVIPTFNRSDYVQKAIDSALNQTYPCQVIVCDHGSSDNTPEVMKRYGSKILYVRKEEDLGPHFCWLDGVLHSKTKYVKLLYDDDWIEPTFIEKTLALMQDDVSCVITNANICFEEEGKVQKSAFFNKTGIFNNFLIKQELLLFGGVISPSCVLFRRDELIDGIYQGKLPIKGGTYYHGVGPDMFVMLIGFLRYPKIGFVNEYLANFRAHNKSITISAGKEEASKKQMADAYMNVIRFYSFLRTFPIFKVLYYLSPTRNLGIILRKNFSRLKRIRDIFIR